MKGEGKVEWEVEGGGEEGCGVSEGRGEGGGKEG